jgi:hypothetical protein
MADSLGLDRARLRKLEQALQAAYEARHRVHIFEQGVDDVEPPKTIFPLEPALDPRTQALERRIAFLQQRVAELEKELEEARAQVAVEVDFSAVAGAGGADDDPVELARRLRQDPRDDETLHAFYRLYEKSGDSDRRWCNAHALVFLGAANESEQAFYAEHKNPALIRPKAALGRDGWTRLLFHPEEEPLTGEIFAVVVGSVLLGRLSALRRDKALPKLDPAKKQDPAVSTIQAVRCFSWAAALFGMQSPALFADPDYPGSVEMVPNIPPVARLGALALSGRSSGELAFLAGRHLAMHREEHFVRLLVPQIKDLEDIYLAALSIGNPGLPLSEKVKQLVVPIAKAIEPILEPMAIDRLRGHFLRLVEEGGRTNLLRWANAVDRTAARAGLLLCDDLKAAHAVLALEDSARADEKMDDLLGFVMSERYAKLRRQIGIAIGG